jgi:hypothetical protein
LQFSRRALIFDNEARDRMQENVIIFGKDL